MRIVVFGGSGAIGRRLLTEFERDHEVTLITRRPHHAPGIYNELWDGMSLGSWTNTLEGADVVINLAGRSVNCRYTPEHLKEMLDSRVDSTRTVGQAITQAEDRPKLWLQMSTATVYSHRFDAPNDEFRGILGGQELDTPPLWKRSVDIAKAWEDAARKNLPPGVRLVLMRTGMVMSTAEGSVFHIMTKLARSGLGGAAAGGRQYISWIHEADFHRATRFLIEHDVLHDVVNVCSPNPLPNRDFNKALRQALGVRIGIPAPKFALELGARAMKTETELILKSRRVVPKKLLEAGFEFTFPQWSDAAKVLAVDLKGHSR